MVLKHRPWRTTEVEAGPNPVFVKRFHDGRFPWGPIGRLRDRQRARNEARRLAELARAGLPVPAVVGIAETANGVELRLEYLSGARPLEELLEEGSAALASRLGTLLARLHAAGFVHGDLHTGNVLVDASGKAWIVDAAAIRRGSSSARTGDLVRAAAEARERTSPRFRARFLLAYLRESRSGRRAEAPDLVEAIERAARIARRERVRAESDRWLRDSGVCARHADGELTLLAPRSIPREEALALGRRAIAGLEGTSLKLLRGRTARAAWRDACRLVEHGIPAVKPLVLIEAPSSIALFEPRADERTPARASPADCRAMGYLAGTLWDRGLELRGAEILVDGTGRASVPVGAGLEAAGTFARALRPWRGRGNAPCWTSSAEFAAAFLDAQRGSRAQLETLRALLAEESKGSHGAAGPA